MITRARKSVVFQKKTIPNPPKYEKQSKSRPKTSKQRSKHSVYSKSQNNSTTANTDTQQFDSDQPNPFNHRITCRQEQQQIIHQFLIDCLFGKVSSKTLYISGVPGVGKTMTVLETMESFVRDCKGVRMENFNAMKLRKPNAIYEVIYSFISKKEKLQTEKVKKSLIGEILENSLRSLKNHYFFLIDEVDYLMTKDQSVYYNLFEWAATIPKFSLIIIANTMNFPQKLSPKIASRLGTNRLVFKPYTQQQIMRIISQIVSNHDIYEQSVMLFLSKKMAKQTSDLRKMTQILRKAQSQRGTKQITKDDIVNIWADLPDTETWQQNIPQFYKNVLEIIKDKGGKTSSDQILIRLQYNYSKNHINQVEYGLFEMRDMGLIKTEHVTRKGVEVVSVTLLKF